MKRIFINGLGLAIGDLIDFEKLTQYLLQNDGLLPEKVTEIPKITNQLSMRKMDRFSKLAVLGATRALNDTGITNTEEVGTIFNSVFGPLNTNINFAQYVVERDLDGASPTLFTNTVNNACVGYVCMASGCKGVSTMLLASNYIGYASKLLKMDKAQTILAGGVEEYSDNLYEAIKEKGYNVVEGSAVLVLETEEKPHSYCEILGYYEAFLGNHPYYCNDKMNYETRIESIINKAMDKVNVVTDEIDAIIQGAPILSCEKKVIDKIFINQKYSLYSMNSDALGASLGIGLGFSSILLRQKKYSHILVTNYDYSGVYRVYILRKV